MFWVFWGTFAVVVALSGWYGWLSLHRYEKNTRYRLVLVSDMVAAVTEKLLNGDASGLHFLGIQLQRTDALHHPHRARTLLLDYLKATPNIASANLVAPDGQVVASTAIPEGQSLPDFRRDPAVWAGFRKALQTHGMRVYHPLQGPLVNHWVIRLSHTVFSPAGKPLFVVATPLGFRDVENFLRHLPLRTGTAVGLLRRDGYLEGRWPVPGNRLAGMLSRPVRGILEQTLERHPHLRHGTYEGVVTAGVATRIGAFTHLDHYPLTAFVSIPRDQWLAAWWRRDIQFPLLFILLFLGGGRAAYVRIVLLDRRWSGERERYEQTLAERATHDALTGLPNREGLRLLLEQSLARAERQERLLAVGFLDLDAFKPVNDTYGHVTGDALLREMGHRLRDTVRQSDTVARLGGDEFVLVLENLRSMEELEQVLARFQEEISRPFLAGAKAVHLQASLGLTVYPFDGEDADLLLRHADQAMYAAKKRTGREGWAQIYSPDLGNIDMGDVLVRQNFVESLSAGAVTLRYQPLVALDTGRVAGLEALARWHCEGQELSPDGFLPALGTRERQALGRFVLKTGLEQLSRWQKKGLDLFLSMNVTPEEFGQRGYAEAVLGTLAKFPDIPPAAVVLEILEVGEILNQGRALAHLEHLRSAGIRIALDDVGSAYASLLRLKSLPIDEIKIDQGFVRELPNRPQDLLFVESLVSLGLGMNVTVTVEGVENGALVALLREMEVHYLQGYAIARPLETEAVADFVRTFVLGSGDADTPLLAIYRHLRYVHAVEDLAMNQGGHEIVNAAVCPVTAWLQAHARELPGAGILLSAHEAIHDLGREILSVRKNGTREETHRLLGQLHMCSHLFQEDLGQAMRTLRDQAST